MKAITAYAIVSWDGIIGGENDICKMLLQRSLIATKADELKTVIEDFMKYTDFPDGSRWSKGDL